ncbi:MAG: hypothetical protein ABIJ81_02780 [Patescibacteria group bacterium]
MITNKNSGPEYLTVNTQLFGFEQVHTGLTLELTKKYWEVKFYKPIFEQLQNFLIKDNLGFPVELLPLSLLDKPIETENHRLTTIDVDKNTPHQYRAGYFFKTIKNHNEITIAVLFPGTDTNRSVALFVRDKAKPADGETIIIKMIFWFKDQKNIDWIKEYKKNITPRL